MQTIFEPHYCDTCEEYQYLVKILDSYCKIYYLCPKCNSKLNDYLD